MQPATIEWIDKAEADFRTATRELAVVQGPNYDAVCFHCQQCAEKYLKGRLQEAGIAFPRSHDLTELLRLVLPIEPSYASMLYSLRTLSVYSVDYRYPGRTADKIEASEALRLCEEVRRTVRTGLRPPV